MFKIIIAVAIFNQLKFACPNNQSYKVEVVANWKNSPEGFRPSGAHFTPTFVIAHDSTVSMW